MIKKLTVILMLLYLNCPAQSDSVLINVNQTIEDLIEIPDGETDDSDFYELIEYYIEHPVDLNRASEKELIKLPYLDRAASQLIISHRAEYGTYFSTNELFSVEGLPEELVSKILPFLSVIKTPTAEKQINEKQLPYSVSIRNRIIKDIQERRGFRYHNFEGSPEKIYNRVNLKYGNFLHAGLLTEKDAGEKSYYDYLAGYVNLTNRYGFNNIIIGDYNVSFGQGLALWNSYGLSRGSDAIFSTKKSASTIKPSTGSSENNFFRGAAFQFSWEHADITGFYSRNSIDALVDSTTGGIISLSADGFHRTENERRKEKSVLEKTMGISFDYSFNSNLMMGLLLYNAKFNQSFIPSTPYDIKGGNFRYISVYLDIILSKFNIYGEISYNEKSTPAYISGLQISLSPEFSYSILLRNYPLDFISVHGSSFGQRSGARSGESGIYNGFRWRTSLGTINFYFDQFKFPYATFTNPLPSEGNEIMFHYSARPFRKCEAGIKVRISNKETTALIDREERIVKRMKQSFRLEYAYTLSPQLKLKTRLEYVSVLFRDYNHREAGYLLFEDIRLTPIERLIVYGRIIFFRTNSFNSAVYEYENDLTGMFSSVGLYAEGVRFYIAARYRLLEKVSISLKYSETLKPKETSLGSGYQLIEGNIDNRISLQSDINF